MFAQCLGEHRLHYQFTKDKKWIHPASGKCLDVENSDSPLGSQIVFRTNCNSKFILKDKEIINIQSQKCVNAEPRRENTLKLSNDCRKIKWRIMVSPKNERKELPTPIFVKERVKKSCNINFNY
eukprot:UN23942